MVGLAALAHSRWIRHPGSTGPASHRSLGRWLACCRSFPQRSSLARETPKPDLRYAGMLVILRRRCPTHHRASHPHSPDFSAAGCDDRGASPRSHELRDTRASCGPSGLCLRRRCCVVGSSSVREYSTRVGSVSAVAEDRHTRSDLDRSRVHPPTRPSTTAALLPFRVRYAPCRFLPICLHCNSYG